MLRSSPDSPATKRRLDAEPEKWQELRDWLHVLLLSNMGQMAPTLAERKDICTLGGWNHELWQPILALAKAIDDERSVGTAHHESQRREEGGQCPPYKELHALMTAHSEKLVEANKEDHFEQTHLTILKALTALIHKEKSPTPAEVLKRAQDMEPKVFEKWTPHKIAWTLRNYGILSVRQQRERQYHVKLDHLRMLERNYGIDLNTENRAIHIAIGLPY